MPGKDRQIQTMEITMKSLKGTKTEKNLMAAFAGESQARNRYTYFASKAKAEGFIQISLVFEETANQEKEHAKRIFNFMDGGDTTITADFPFGSIGSTKDNLLAASNGERHEWTVMYTDIAKTAREEGFEAIGIVFDAISVAEKQHGKRFADFAANIEADKVFKADEKVVWRCTNCGYLFEGVEAPKACPACAHPQAYFERLGENW